MVKKMASFLLLVLLAGCHQLQPFIYNMTPYPIDITFSTKGRDFTTTACLPPGLEFITYGVAVPKLTSLIITDNTGKVYAYSTADLAALRPPHSSDMWAFYPSGLRYIPKAERSPFEAQFERDMNTRTECQTDAVQDNNSTTQ